MTTLYTRLSDLDSLPKYSVIVEDDAFAAVIVKRSDDIYWLEGDETQYSLASLLELYRNLYEDQVNSSPDPMMHILRYGAPDESR